MKQKYPAENTVPITIGFYKGYCIFDKEYVIFWTGYKWMVGPKIEDLCDVKKGSLLYCEKITKPEQIAHWSEW